MKKKIFCFTLILTIAIGNNILAQQTLLTTGGDGNGSGGTFSFSFGQFAYQSFFEGNSSIAQGVQHSFELFDTGQTVPDNFELNNTTITEGELLCFNAIEKITVAGNEGNVDVEPGSTADFIAGQSIRFLPGFHAKPGSYVQGRITITGDFCDGYIVPGIIQAPLVAEKSIELKNTEPQPDDIAPNMAVKVYPNPNNGRFKIDFINFEPKAKVFVYNQMGALFYSAGVETNSNIEVELPNVHSGLYYVRVVAINQQFVNKIIIN